MSFGGSTTQLGEYLELPSISYPTLCLFLTDAYPRGQLHDFTTSCAGNPARNFLATDRLLTHGPYLPEFVEAILVSYLYKALMEGFLPGLVEHARARVGKCISTKLSLHSTPAPPAFMCCATGAGQPARQQPHQPPSADRSLPSRVGSSKSFVLVFCNLLGIRMV